EKGLPDDLRKALLPGSGGRIRTYDLWVMSQIRAIPTVSVCSESMQVIPAVAPESVSCRPLHPVPSRDVPATRPATTANPAPPRMSQNNRLHECSRGYTYSDREERHVRSDHESSYAR